MDESETQGDQPLPTPAQMTQLFATSFVALLQRFGIRKTWWVLDFLASWGLAVRANQWQGINADEYAAYWRISRAKAYRDQGKWRAMFPDELTPNERVIAARRNVERYQTQVGRPPSKADLVAVFGSITPTA